MSNKTSCDDEYDPNSMEIGPALQRIKDSISPVSGNERVFIREAMNRVLSEDVLSPIDVPAYTNSAMDGYAVRSSDLPKSGETSLAIVARVMAGHPFEGDIQSGQCARIMTGAPLPNGVDTVVMQEHVTLTDDSAICIDSRHRVGQNVRQAGEDLQKGGVALQKGKKLTAADLGLIASLGIAEVSVKRRVRVAFFSTGDELCSIGDPLKPGQIYDSNRYTLHGLLKQLDVEIIDMGIIRDDKQMLRNAYSTAAQIADVLITTGGVSVGEADFVTTLLAEMGQVNFWKIAMKPGRPLTFGQLQNCYFFGLPGNPVSAMVTFQQFVKPGLRKLMGMSSSSPVSLQMQCVDALKKRPGRVDFQRGIMFADENGEWKVKSTGPQGSHILNSMSLANCFIVLPLECSGIEAGEWVEVQVFEN